MEEAKAEKEIVEEIVEEVETDSIENIEQFSKIIRTLNDKNLAILHQCLHLEGWMEKMNYLKTFRNESDLESYYILYYSFMYRDLVLNPIEYIQDEILMRFNKLHLGIYRYKSLKM